MDRERSHSLYGRALGAIPGGVNSPVRAVRPYPFFVERGEGATIVDVDGNRYLDYVMGYGPLLLGHTPPDSVRDAVEARIDDGVMFGAPVAPEVELAECIIDHVTSVEKVRFTNSGSEAVSTAIRLARGITGRDKIVTMGGGYHGALDTTVVDGDFGSPGRPGSPGIPEESAANTIPVPFNDEDAARAVFETHGTDIAAILVEPMLGNQGFVHPVEGYLTLLRELTHENGALLIFDEVMTGFRIGGLGCAQSLVGVRPDLTTFAKVIGGGFPVAAIGGRTEYMERLTPSGEVFHASTYAGHPVGMVAGLETLRYAENNDVYDRMAELGDSLREGLSEILADHAPSYTVVGRDSMFKVIFTRDGAEPQTDPCGAGCRQDPTCDRFGSCPKSGGDIDRADGERWERLFWQDMLSEGILLTANQHECQFLSAAHTEEDVEQTLEAYKRALSR